MLDKLQVASENETDEPISPSEIKLAQSALDECRKRLRRGLRRITRLTSEDAHAMRVTTRRAEAALVLFAPLLPQKATRRLRVQLRKLRRRLGPVRNEDLFVERCFTWTTLAPPEMLAKLIVASEKKRRRAARKLRRKFNAAWREKLSRRFEQLIAALHESRNEGASIVTSSLAGSLLISATRKPLAHVRRLVSISVAETDTLHNARLACKRLRYLFELVNSLEPNPQRAELIQRLRAAQDRLGDLLDTLAASHYLQTVLKSATRRSEASVLEEINAHEQAKLTTAVAELQLWWQETKLAQLLTESQEPSAAITGEELHAKRLVVE